MITSLELGSIAVFALLYGVSLGVFKKTKRSEQAAVSAAQASTPETPVSLTHSEQALLAEFQNLQKLIQMQQTRVIAIHNARSNHPAYLIPTFGSKPNAAYFDAVAQAETIRRNLVENFQAENDIKIILPSSVSRLNKIRPYAQQNRAELTQRNNAFPYHLINFN